MLIKILKDCLIMLINMYFRYKLKLLMNEFLSPGDR